MRRYGVDAAILYSDIVVPVAAIGFGVDVAPGTGPVVSQPFRTAADLDRLRPLDPEADTPYVLETVSRLVKELDVPLIGFAGAPFTVASYLVEGGPTRTWAATKRLMYGDEPLWHDLLDRLAGLATDSLRSQVLAGAQAVQLFDSWAGQLSPSDYRRYVLPHSAKVLEGLADLDVPRIHFGVGTGELLELLAEAGADVVGVDWRVDLADARRRLGSHAVQGNLDPAVCLSPWPVVEQQGARGAGGQRGGAPATSSTSATACSPRPTRRSSAGSSTWCTGRRSPDARRAGRLMPRQPGAAPTGAAERVAVLLMAYGTPASRDDVEAYYTDIRRGRPPTPEQVADLVRRYDAIGGLSPLAARTEAQRQALQAALDERSPGTFDVVLGMKHAAPRIEDAVTALGARGIRRAIGLVLAPHDSALSIGDYLERAESAGQAAGVALTGHPLLARPACLRRRSRPGRSATAWPACPRARRCCSPRTASRPGCWRCTTPTPGAPRPRPRWWPRPAGLGPWTEWGVAWQSAGRTPEPWLGPDVLTVIDDLAAEGAPGVLVCACGFVADHLEVLYDLDIEARQRADAAGLAFARTPCVNDDPAVLGALGDLVVAAA